MVLAAKLRKNAWKQAQLLVEIQHPGKGDAYNWMMCDKFCRRYEELEVLTKESYETIQKNLEYYHELQDAFDDINKMSCDQLADYLRKINNGYDLSQSNLMLSQEKVEYWQKDLEKLQKDYKKYEIKLLKKGNCRVQEKASGSREKTEYAVGKEIGIKRSSVQICGIYKG